MNYKYVYLYFIKNLKNSPMDGKIHLKIRQIKQIFKKNQFFLEKLEYIVYYGRYFSLVFSKRHLEAFGRTTVGENFGSTSVGRENIKKLTKSPQNLRYGLA